MSVPGAGEHIKQVVSSWPGVESRPHRFGGVEYRLGLREIGHVHGDHLLDIPFPKRVRDRLVEAGEALPHHIYPQTGWVSFYIREETDVARAIALLQQSYDIAVQQAAGPARP